jgi:hypothetical protein
MKRLLIFSLICFLSGLMTIACERGVRAGREGETETYQPRPAPMEEQTSTATNQQMKGELMRVDQKNRTVTVRAENGMEQTFKVNNRTKVNPPRTGPPVAVGEIRDLEGKEGSEVVIAWVDEAGAKTAATIDVSGPMNKSDTKAKTRGRY